MIKVKKIQEIEAIPQQHLREYLLYKTQEMFAEYGVDNMDSIGCYVILNEDEFAIFPIAESEFVEMLTMEDEAYLHGVHILSDDCAEDIYLPIEVLKC